MYLMEVDLLQAIQVDELLCMYISHFLKFIFLDLCGQSFQEM
jgi:hypothetical protein